MTAAAASKAARSARIVKERQERLQLAQAAKRELDLKHPDMPLDQFLCNPKLESKLCARVRRKFPNATDEQILGGLLYLRKRKKK
jgi:hypothetical protein